MSDNNSFSLMDNILEEKSKYASDIDRISFMTDNVKSINVKKIQFLEANIDRPNMISKLATLLKDIDTAFKIEAGVFEFTLVYCATKNYIANIMPAVYNDKIYELSQNLNPENLVQNKTLINAIQEGKINPQMIAFLKPQDLHPQRWEALVKKANLREEKKKNLAVTDLYTCWKCKEKRCTVMEMQCRSSDEPMTKFITCTNCYTVMKK